MAGRDGEGKKFAPGSRKYDRTIDDALRTMERFAAWLANAKQENVWLQAEDPLQVAMLYGMMTYLRQAIDEVLTLGGEDVEATAGMLRSFASQLHDEALRGQDQPQLNGNTTYDAISAQARSPQFS